MFDFSWLSWLGIGGLGTAGVLGLAAYFLGAKYVVEAMSPILKKVAEIAADGLGMLWTGLKGLFDTVGDFFMVLLLIAGTWTVATAQYKLELKDTKFVHAQELAKCGKKSKQPATGGNGIFPFDFLR